MEAITVALSLAALVVSLAALTLALRGARRR